MADDYEYIPTDKATIRPSDRLYYWDDLQKRHRRVRPGDVGYVDGTVYVRREIQEDDDGG